MPHVTTCPSCASLYEESSEEDVNDPARRCRNCRAAKGCPDQGECEHFTQIIGPAIDEVLNADKHEVGGRRVGFCLAVFAFGDKGSPLAFISNANADDLKNALLELVDRLGDAKTVQM